MSSEAVRRPGVVTFVGVILLVQAFLAAVEGVVLLAFRDNVQDFLAEYGETLSDATSTGLAIGSLLGALLLALAGFGILGGSGVWRLLTVVTLLIGFFVIWALYGHSESEEYFESR